MVTRLDLTRREDWPERLAALIEQQAARKFEWGAHDCVTAWADNCRAMTGVDPMVEFRGKYHDEVTAAAALKIIGFGSLYHTMTRKFGKPVAPGMARRGDPLIFDGPVLLTCLGEECTGPGLDGPQRLPTMSARFAWRVG